MVTNGPTLMILVIAVAAAYGGYVEGQTADKIQDLRSEIKFEEQNLETMINQANQMIAEDIDYQIRALYYLDEAWMESWSYTVIKSDLSPAEENERLENILSNVLLAAEWIDRTFTYTLYQHFETDGSDLEVFGQAEITESDYLALTTSLLEGWDFETFMASYGEFGFGSIADIIAYTGPATLETINIDGLVELLSIPIRDKYNVLADLSNEVYAEESKQAGLRMAISVITVATVLSAAMASRLRFRKTQVAFSEVRADLNKSEEYLIGSGDKIAAIILSVGVLMASFGLLMAI